MWYLIILVVIVLTGIFVWASINKKKKGDQKKPDKPPFRTEEVLSTYEKPMEDSHAQHVDFDDAE